MTDPYAPRDYVPQGYLPPADAYQQPHTVGPDPYDPLVNPAYSGINGWFTRIGWMFRRSWKSMAAIFAITHVIPLIGFAVVGVVAALLLGTALLSSFAAQDSTGQVPQLDPDLLAIGVPVIVLIILLLVLVFVFLQSVGYAAATYAVTREAAGAHVRLGEALGYGFRRGLGLTGWIIVVGLLTLLGFVACILPGIYVYAATALVGPIYLFERHGAIGRSFSIFNANLGRVLGRLALIFVATFIGNAFGSIFDQIGTAAVGASDDLNVLVAATALSSVAGIVVSLPVTMLTFSGILLTYAEQRAYEGPANTATLAAEL